MIKLTIRKKMAPKLKHRLTRKLRCRRSDLTDGSQDRPRMCIFRSNKYIYVQLVNDQNHRVILSASTLQKGLKESGKSNKTIESAKKLGADIARKAIEKGIESVVFDRNGYLFHGKLKAIAEAAREAGLKF